MKPAASRKDPAVLLRLPRDLVKRVGEAAKKSARSRNSEIVLRLQKSLDEQPKLEQVA